MSSRAYKLVLALPILLMLFCSVPGLAQEAGKTPDAAPVAGGEAAPGPEMTVEQRVKSMKLQMEGNKHFAKGEYRKALVQYGEAVKLAPSLLNCWEDMGLCYVALGETKMARYCMDKIKELGGDSGEIEKQLGDTVPPILDVLGIKPREEAPTKAELDQALAAHTAAGKLMGESKFDEAVEKLKASLRLMPDSAGVWEDLAICLSNTSDSRTAFKATRQAEELGVDVTELYKNLDSGGHPFGIRELDEEPTEEVRNKANALHAEATRLFQLGMFNRAAETLLDSLELVPSSVGAWEDLVLNYIHAHEIRLARIGLEYLRTREGADVASLEKELSAMPNSEIWQLGIKLSNRDVSMEDEQAAQVEHVAASKAMGEGEFKQAIVRLKGAITQAPNNETYWSDLALCYITLGKMDLAEIAMAQVVKRGGSVDELRTELTKRGPGPAKELGIAIPDAVPTKEAFAAAEKAHGEASKLVEDSLYDQALPKLREALKYNPHSSDIWSDMALCYIHTRKWREAKLTIAQVKLMGGDTKFLEEEVEKVSTVGSRLGIDVPERAPTPEELKEAEAAHTKAIQAFDNKDYAQAEDLLKQSLEKNSGANSVWADLALTYIRANKLDKAGYALNQAKLRKADVSMLEKELADLSTAADGDLGISYLDSVPSAEQLKQAEALHNKGIKAAEAGKFLEAVRHYRESIGINSGIPDLWADMAMALMQAGDLDKAKMAIKKVAELKADTRELDAELARLSSDTSSGLGLNFPEEEPTKEMLDKAYSFHQAAAVFFAKKEYSEAVKQLRSSLENNPGVPDAWQDLALGYIYVGEQTKADLAIAEAKQMKARDIGFVLKEYRKAFK